MKYYFTLNGVSSTEFGAYVATSTMFDAPERDADSVEIPGRNGNVTLDNGRYKNISAKLNCYIPHEMHVNVDGIRAWLLSNTGYCRYEDNIHPDFYRMARYVGGFELDENDRVGASFALSFDCMPQRFLKSGELGISPANGATLYNPTRFDALPLIVCSGNGTITINGTTVTITGNTGKIYIDCDTQNAYNGTTNKNGFITPNFPKLSPGENTVTYSGVTDVQIIPRWWTI